jgi:drug/metabolite transporter (DMT)-like permease
MGSYTSLQYLSLSDATVLGFLAPSVTGVLAALFLKEPYTWKEATAGLVSLGGTVLVAQPAFLFGGMVQDEYGVTPEERLMAVGIALMGVLGASGAYVTIRQIGKRAHALHGVQYFCMVGPVPTTNHS